MSKIILDIDNCIANDGWRIRYIDWSLSGDDRWERYHSRAGYDFACNRHLVRKLHPEDHVLFFTGRPEHHRAYTERWIENNYLPRGREYTLIMRRKCDEGVPAVELKREMLRRHAKVEEIVAAYDDRSDVVEMYKSFGINASVLAIHNKDAYVPPKTQQH